MFLIGMPYVPLTAERKKAYDYMTAKGITAFYPTIDTVKTYKW